MTVSPFSPVHVSIGEDSNSNYFFSALQILKIQSFFFLMWNRIFKKMKCVSDLGLTDPLGEPNITTLNNYKTKQAMYQIYHPSTK